MIQLHKRYSVLLAVIIGSSFLSACSGTQPTSSVSSSVLQSKNIVSPVSSAGEYPALIPVSNDSESCLQQELEALRRTGTWENSGQPFTGTLGDTIHSDFPVALNRQVQMYLDFFQNEQRKLFANWLSKSKQYVPMMQRELKSAGLPMDLAYLAMIESGFNQRACSSAQATGLWQFMTDTGRQYNLRIDHYVDERRDAEKSTRAAVALLGNLYHEFGDWNLAVAAYNAGSGKIAAGLKKYNVNTFWDLARQQYLSLETIRYVPELMAAIIIAKDPEKYGFTDIKYSSMPAYETLEVGPGLGLDGLALVTNSSKEDLQLLNQELIAGKTPLTDRKFQVKIPVGTRTLALTNLPRLRSVASTEFKTHTIGRHETLASIGRKYNVSLADLLRANHSKSKRYPAGHHLQIPISIVHYQLGHDKGEAIAQADSKQIYHLHNTKEKIQALSENTSQSQYSRRLLSSHKARQLSDPTVLTAHNQVSSRTTKDEFRWYKIENGDTLWTISQKFKTSLNELKGWNNLKSDAIHPGDRLRVKEPNQILAERIKNTVF